MKYPITTSTYQTRIIKKFLWLPLELPFDGDGTLYGPRQKRWLEMAKISQYKYHSIWWDNYWTDSYPDDYSIF